MHHGNILLISDGSPIFPALSRFLMEAGHQVTITEQTRETFQALRTGKFPLAIACLSNDWTDTRPFIKKVREISPKTVVIILQPGPEVRSPVGAYLIKDTAYEFKSFGWPGLRRLVANCVCT